MELVTDDAGRLISHAWPGGYPVVYYFADGGDCCPKCANRENGSLAYVGDSPDGIEDRQWKIVASDVNYEDQNLYCDHCNAKIEPAYGE